MKPAAGVLLTDYYELTMLQAYFLERMDGIAAFEFFVRKLPAGRNFLVAAGLQQVVEYLESLQFEEAEMDWLLQGGRFRRDFVQSLRGLCFTGNVDALPEGTVFFPDEPVLRIVAPIREAQLVESRIINLVQYQTLVASKAARVVLAAHGKRLVDFGLRRAHGAEAGLLAARASCIAGFDGSATAEAGREFGIPVSGTMAHSFIQAHRRETEAFAAFARAFPHSPTLLIDTYDTEAAARSVVRLAHALHEERGIRIGAVRIDSGDLGEQARKVRHILDDGGCLGIRIFASGNLDEYAVRELLDGGAPIDAFGIGTRVTTSSDAPYFDCAYKLVEYAGHASRKRSTGKMTWPGRKQVFRVRDPQGRMSGDTLCVEGEQAPGEPQLQPVMRNGRRVGALPALGAVREHARAELGALPEALKRLEPAAAYPLAVSDGLRALVREVDAAEAAEAAEAARAAARAAE